METQKDDVDVTLEGEEKFVVEFMKVRVFCLAEQWEEMALCGDISL
jgi:hypothetical protein